MDAVPCFHRDDERHDKDGKVILWRKPESVVQTRNTLSFSFSLQWMPSFDGMTRMPFIPAKVRNPLYKWNTLHAFLDTTICKALKSGKINIEIAVNQENKTSMYRIHACF
jgi:hypothetical protein